MSKKPITASSLGGLINPEAAPVDTGVPQRGAIPSSDPRAERQVEPAHDPSPARTRQEPERRSDMMSIRMKPSYRNRILAMADTRKIQIAQIIEEAIDLYEKKIAR